MFRSIEMVIASEREAYAQKIFEDLNVHRPQAHHPLNQPKNPQTSSYISPESVRRWSLSTRWLTHNSCSRIMHGRRNINYVLKVSFFQRSQHTRGAELIYASVENSNWNNRCCAPAGNSVRSVDTVCI